MDEDTFRNKVNELFKQRKDKGCPTTDCPYLHNTLFTEVASNAFDLSMDISALMLLHNIELDVNTISELLYLVSRKLLGYNIKSINLSFELCQACSMSKLIGDQNIQ